MARRIRGNTDHCRAQNFTMEDVAGLEFLENSVVRVIGGFYAFDGVMKIWIEALAFGFDFLNALLREDVKHLFANQFEADTKLAVGSIAMRGDGAVETVEHGEQIFHEGFGAAMALLMAFTVGALAVIVEIGLEAKQRIFQVGFFGNELFEFVADDFLDGGLAGDVRTFRLTICVFSGAVLRLFF